MTETPTPPDPDSEPPADLTTPDPSADEVASDTEAPGPTPDAVASDEAATDKATTMAGITDEALLAAAAAPAFTTADDAESDSPVRDDYDLGVSDRAEDHGPADHGTQGHAAGVHTPGQPAPPPPPPPAAPGYPAAPAPMRLYRSRHDRKVGGVSAGIAEYFGIDPTLARLGMFAFIISGLGILVYIAAWVVVPLRPEGMPYQSWNRTPEGDKSMRMAFGLAALALAFGVITGSWEILAITLIGGGIWLLSEQTRASAPALAGIPYSGSQQAPATSSFAPAAYADMSQQTTYEPPVPGAVAPSSPYPQAAYSPPPVAEKKPQRITWLVLSLLALLTAVGIAAASGGWWDVSATRLLGIGIVIIGLGVVAGQIRNGGARGLIPLGILCAFALIPVSAVDGLVDDGIGESVIQPLSADSLEPSYSHGIGKFTVDLSDFDFDGRDEEIDVELGIGELIVIVPDDVGGRAVLEVGAGEIYHRVSPDASGFNEGLNVDSDTVILGGDAGSVRLDISVGLGTAELVTASNS